MSHEASIWALNLPHKNATHKVVLLGLANHADPTGGKCFPSITRLELYTGLSRRTVIRAIKQMEELGIISAIHTKGKSTQYQLNIDLELVPEEHQCQNGTSVTDDTTSATDDTNWCQSDTLTINNHQEPSIIYDQFEQFWELYPRKVGKRKAQKEFERAMKRGSMEAITEGLLKQNAAWLAAETPVKFIPHPTTWLHRDGWEDEPAQPEQQQSRLQRSTAILLERGNVQ